MMKNLQVIGKRTPILFENTIGALTATQYHFTFSSRLSIRNIGWRNFSSKVGRRRPIVIKKSSTITPPPASGVVPVEDSWVEVIDKSSGQPYYWNKVTNETTALNALKPTGPTSLEPAPPQAPTGGIASGLGRVVAEGFAFGVGSSVAHGIVGSIFGGGSTPSNSGGESGDSGGLFDDFDI
eukprot:gene15117-20339_t